jgi:hypothetical protein
VRAAVEAANTLPFPFLGTRTLSVLKGAATGTPPAELMAQGADSRFA